MMQQQQQQQQQQVQFGKHQQRINNNLKSNSSQPKEYYDTFGAGEIDFSEDNVSPNNDNRHHQGNQGAFYGDSSLNQRMSKQRSTQNASKTEVMRMANMQSSDKKKKSLNHYGPPSMDNHQLPRRQTNESSQGSHFGIYSEHLGMKVGNNQSLIKPIMNE